MTDTPKMPRGRRSHEQWRDMMAAAEACLQIDAVRQFGLIEGGPEINAERCVSILETGKARGFTVHQETVDA